MALALPAALLSSQGDFVGWGLWGDLWGLFCLAPASVHEMYGKIMWGLSGTQLLSCTFLYSLQETEMGSFSRSTETSSNLISYCIISWATS